MLEVASSRNLSRFYSYANSKLEYISDISLGRSDGTIATSDLDKCNRWNEYFVSVFTMDDGILSAFAHHSPVMASLGSVLWKCV